jgi:type IV pilus assembly protein PilM
MPPSLNLNIGRRSGGDVVGLDIQPGLVAAVQARVNGAILAERAAAAELPADAVREGDIVDDLALRDCLRELFGGSRLGKRVRIGIANQRTVMRTLELPPITDAKELAAAVQFQAQDQIPMPIASAVLDFQALGIVDTPAGPRQRVTVVAAQREMVQRLLAAVRGAGLVPVGIDLSAFALIRSLYRGERDHDERVLYVNIDGLTNIAIAEGALCRFTRVVGGGLEEMAIELAERRSIPLEDARTLLASVDLRAPSPADVPESHAAEEPTMALEGSAAGTDEPEPAAEPQDASAAGATPPAEYEPPDLSELANASAGAQPAPPAPPHGGAPATEHASEAVSGERGDAASAGYDWEAEARLVLENGIRAISGEIRNSLDFHRSQEGGGAVNRVVLSGFALDLPGFPDALAAALGVDVHPAAVALADAQLAERVSTHRLSIAAGLAATEVPG